MFKVKTSARLAIFVAMIVSGNLWLGIMLKMIPDPAVSLSQNRRHLAENIAVSAATLVRNSRSSDLYSLIDQLNERNEDLVSTGVRYRDGTLRHSSGPHEQMWVANQVNSQQISVEVTANGRHWGTLELRFTDPPQLSWLAQKLQYPQSYVAFTSALTCLLVWLTFSQTFKYLNPSKVVPGRVRSALDSLTEGLVLLNSEMNIVHANEAFADMVGIPFEELIGGSISAFVWTKAGENQQMPWELALRTNGRVNGEVVEFTSLKAAAKYNVNANPIFDGNGKPHGVLVSFDDVTVLEEKKRSLAEMLETLRASRDEIQKQNSQLRFLASRDPLTKCFNRRSFWEIFEANWNSVPKHLLNIIMVDIDHFKSINDNYGHSKGDDVLRETGALLQKLVGQNGSVCRYGGEEIAILLPNLEFSKAADFAKAIHEAFQRCQIGGLNITASIGVSNRSFGAMDTQHLLDQADQCLYSAKRSGRNQVITFDTIVDSVATAPEPEFVETNDEWTHAQISNSSVTAMLSALALRDHGRAKSAMQLADLCMALGRKRLNHRSRYLLEVAALLNEIGLLNNGISMSDSEQLLQMSRTFLESSFGSPAISWILSPEPELSELPIGETSRQQLFEARTIFRLAKRYLNSLDQEAGNSLITNGHSTDESDSIRFDELKEAWLGICHDRNEKEVESSRDNFPATWRRIDEHAHDLYSAMGSRNLSELRKAIARLQHVTVEPGTVLSEQLENLRSSAERRDAQLDDLVDLTESLLDLCRSIRANSLHRPPQPTTASPR